MRCDCRTAAINLKQGQCLHRRIHDRHLCEAPMSVEHGALLRVRSETLTRQNNGAKIVDIRSCGARYDQQTQLTEYA